MVNVKTEITEMRFKIFPDYTRVKIFVVPDPIGDMVGYGWHAYNMPPDVPTVDIILKRILNWEYVLQWEYWGEVIPTDDRPHPIYFKPPYFVRDGFYK